MLFVLNVTSLADGNDRTKAVASSVGKIHDRRGKMEFVAQEWHTEQIVELAELAEATCGDDSWIFVEAS